MNPLVSSSKNRRRPALEAGSGAPFFLLLIRDGGARSRLKNLVRRARVRARRRTRRIPAGSRGARSRLPGPEETPPPPARRRTAGGNGGRLPDRRRAPADLPLARPAAAIPLEPSRRPFCGIPGPRSAGRRRPATPRARRTASRPRAARPPRCPGPPRACRRPPRIGTGRRGARSCHRSPKTSPFGAKLPPARHRPRRNFRRPAARAEASGARMLHFAQALAPRGAGAPLPAPRLGRRRRRLSASSAIPQAAPRIMARPAPGAPPAPPDRPPARRSAREARRGAGARAARPPAFRGQPPLAPPGRLDLLGRPGRPAPPLRFLFARLIRPSIKKPTVCFRGRHG